MTDEYGRLWRVDEFGQYHAVEHPNFKGQKYEQNTFIQPRKQDLVGQDLRDAIFERIVDAMSDLYLRIAEGDIDPVVAGDDLDKLQKVLDSGFYHR